MKPQYFRFYSSYLTCQYTFIPVLQVMSTGDYNCDFVQKQFPECPKMDTECPKMDILHASPSTDIHMWAREYFGKPL